MSDKKPIAVLYEVGKAKCTFTGKTCDGVVVSFADGSIKRKHLSWAVLRKLIEFKHVDTEAISGEAAPES